MQVIPAIDLLGDYAVRLERGDYEKVLFEEPVVSYVARVLATIPPLIHVVDLEGARDGALRPAVVARVTRLTGATPLQVSGGLRTVDVARATLAAGAARVIVGTALWSREDALATWVDALGDQLVAALDVRGGELLVRGWLAGAGVDVATALQRCVNAGVTRLHVTAIDRDGTMTGPDLALYEQAVASGLRVVAAGGVRDASDVRALERLGCEAAVLGVGYFAAVDEFASGAR